MERQMRHRLGFGLLAFGLAAVAAVPAWAAASAFDGTYSGTSSPEWAVQGCGTQQKSITIEVAGGEAWTHHHRMTGKVDGGGHLSMADGSGRSELTATIQGNSLTGTETIMASPKKLRGFYSGDETQCMRTLSAQRQ